jgi:hypothetical protein
MATAAHNLPSIQPTTTVGSNIQQALDVKAELIRQLTRERDEAIELSKLAVERSGLYLGFFIAMNVLHN